LAAILQITTVKTDLVRFETRFDRPFVGNMEWSCGDLWAAARWMLRPAQLRDNGCENADKGYTAPHDIGVDFIM
jgi:hypothetical protein